MDRSSKINSRKKVLKSRDLPLFALTWCRQLGVSPDTLIPLRGGINNKVFLCSSGRKRFVLKGYASHKESEHSRYKSEVEFLRYAQNAAPSYVPRLISFDGLNQSIVLEYIKGEIFHEGFQPNKKNIYQAVEFMSALNRNFQNTGGIIMGPAAEGYLHLTEHLNNVFNRIKKMSTQHLPATIHVEAQKSIKTLKNLFEEIQNSTKNAIERGHCEDALDPRRRCISPSDFGFHNAIRTKNGLKFFDFEFAGWDDPAKVIADFDLQPRFPIFPRNRVLKGAIPEDLRPSVKRTEALFAILRIKWACIILAVLDPERWKHISRDEPYKRSEKLVKNKIQLSQSYIKCNQSKNK